MSNLTLTQPTLPIGSAGHAYAATIAPIGGTPPYTFVVTAGSLPPGLTLDPATGIISGAPANAIFSEHLLRLDSSTKNDEGYGVEYAWESGLVRGINDFAVRMIRVGNLDVWVRGNGALLTQVFGPDKKKRVLPPLLDRQGEPATLSDEPGTMYQEKFDLAHVENWTVRFSTNGVGQWFELSEFVGYAKPDLSNK